MSTPTNLLTIEIGGEHEVLESSTSDYDHYGQEASGSDQIIVIRGTLTVSP